MVIDCHTHIAPDRFAQATGEAMRARFGLLAGLPSVAGLRACMQEAGITTSLVFNVAHRPDLVKKANDFVIEITDHKTVIGIGTIHPAGENLAAEVERLRAARIPGIKLHALVQGFAPDDERVSPAYEAMGDDMVAYFHCGKDPGDLSAPVLATAESILNVRKRFPRLKIVAAHFGGLFLMEQARALLGKDIYLDTVWYPGLEVLEPKEIAALIKTHGSERVVFGTDYPSTSGVKRQVDWMRALPVDEQDKENILWRNAKQLFAIN